MPTDQYRRPQVGRNPMAMASPGSYRPPATLIGTWSYEAVGDDLFAMSNAFYLSTTYPATNRVHAYPFELADYFLVQKVWWVNGVTATTDACDVGVYTEAGTTLLVSGGSTNIATANVVQEKDCTDTLLTPGRYWCAYNQNGVTATPHATQPAATASRAAGCAQMAGAVPLGATFTPAAVAANFMPIFGIASRTQVA